MILNVRRARKKFESKMEFEPTTLRYLVGCSNHCATGDSMVSKGQCVATIESLVARWLEHPTRPWRMWAQIPSGSRIFFPSFHYI